jgi:radical SAM superfamily enzyme
VKLHNLYAVRNTRLADQVRRGQVELMSRQQYVRTAVDFLERLPPAMLVDRVVGDAPREFLVEPAWCLDKPATLAGIDAEFARRGTCQGTRAAAGGG